MKKMFRIQFVASIGLIRPVTQMPLFWKEGVLESKPFNLGYFPIYKKSFKDGTESFHVLFTQFLLNVYSLFNHVIFIKTKKFTQIYYC